MQSTVWHKYFETVSDKQMHIVKFYENLTGKLTRHNFLGQVMQNFSSNIKELTS